MSDADPDPAPPTPLAPAQRALLALNLSVLVALSAWVVWQCIDRLRPRSMLEHMARDLGAPMSDLRTLLDHLPALQAPESMPRRPATVAEVKVRLRELVREHEQRLAAYPTVDEQPRAVDADADDGAAAP